MVLDFINFFKKKKDINNIALNFAERVVVISIECAKEVANNNLKGVNVDDFFEAIGMEFLWLYVHVASRSAFSLPIDKKEQFINITIDHIPYLFIKNVHGEFALNKLAKDKDSLEKLLDFFKEHCDTRMDEYSKYKELMFAKNQPEEGTLLWEFSKIISSEVLKTSSYLEKMKIIEICAYGIQSLAIVKTVESVR